MTTTAALDQIKAAFTVLADSPHAPTVPAAIVDTHDPATITETQSILQTANPQRRDRIWAHVVHQARAADTWVTLAAGLALPGLRRAAARVARICPSDDAADSDAEVLSGFLTALADIDPSQERICSRLCQAAFSAGRSYARRQIRAARTKQRALESRMPPPASGHTDLVLADAVRAGIISRHEADLIGATRLDHEPLHQLAARLGEPEPVLCERRMIAETALTKWIMRN